MERNQEEIRKTYFKYYRTKRSLEFMNQCDSWEAWRNVQEKLRARRRKKSLIWSMSSAAAVILVVVHIGYIHTTRYLEKKELMMMMTSYSFPETRSKAALLVFDDGMTVDLSKRNGKIKEEGENLKIANEDHQLVYISGENVKEESKYNTLYVPRGGEYRLVLADGTKVWLNAESSLRYPEVFGDKREVVLTGEAYFEVAKDSLHPFIVNTEKQSVEVLGTHFNISAYPEDIVYTTLAEGRVKVNSGSVFVVLDPNEQAVIITGQENIEVRKVDASLFTSWIKGKYEFKNTELESIAAQLSRWYNVDIRFADETLKHRRFAGIVYRDEELGFAIEVIERVANVRFIRENDLIYIRAVDIKK